MSPQAEARNHVLTPILEIIPGSHASVLATYVNFHPAEDGFAWSRSSWGEVQFENRGRAAQVSRLEADLDIFRQPSAKDPQRDCFLFLNGALVGCANTAGRSVISFSLPPNGLRPDSNRLTFMLDHALCPNDFGVPDTRTLGFQLFRVRFLAEAPRAAVLQSALPAERRLA